jgi:hypothetical protein
MARIPKRSQREPIVIKFQRCKHNKIGVLVDANLDVRRHDELRRWAARKVNFVVIDTETGVDITRILLA